MKWLFFIFVLILLITGCVSKQQVQEEESKGVDDELSEADNIDEGLELDELDTLDDDLNFEGL